MDCTGLDHIYPRTVPGTPCYCGKRTWGGRAARATVRRKLGIIAVGVVVVPVRASNCEANVRTVERRLRQDGETLFVLSAPVSGRIYWSAGELEVVR